MAIVEDITEDSGDSQHEPLAEVLASLAELTSQLVLPASLVPEFMRATESSDTAFNYRQKVIRVLEAVHSKVKDVDEGWGWEEVSVEEHGRLLGNIPRLYGHDVWTSKAICQKVDDLTPHLPSTLPLALLPTLRPYFAPHPSLSAASRALPRPSGGHEATQDLHDTQPFKSAEGWGLANLLAWCAGRLAPEEIEKHIGVVLPPTLVLMDDWEPAWRERGVEALSVWVGKLDAGVLRRMGLDKLLLDSLIHTLSLHANPPLKAVLPTTLKLIEQCVEKGEKRARRYEDVMEKAFVQGWVYAPSGLEGRVVLVHISEELEVMCEVLGSGIVRWLKTIIPHLLDPLQYSPTPAVLPHFTANLSALLCVMRTVKPTGRISRWRGQILNVLSRLWVQLKERQGLDDDSLASAPAKRVQSLVKNIFDELASQTPSVREEEYPRILKLAPALFSDLIPTPPAAA
ncbi:hypothetical protein IAT38_000892 [Cryptococcus sp. DSM 104549]